MSLQHRICDHPLYVHPDVARLAEIAAERVIAIGADALARHGAFHLALSGGTTPRHLYRALAQPERQARLDWGRVHLYFGDERAVPPDHPDSNFRMARETLIDHVPTPAAQVHRMVADPAHIEADAQAYARVLATHLPQDAAGMPVFDLILLGLGTDGHTCSLFPGTEILDDRAHSVAAVHATHLDSWRLSLTYPVLNAARHLLFLVAGAGKAAIMARICGPSAADAARLPVERIEPGGAVEWHLDRAAGGNLAS